MNSERRDDWQKDEATLLDYWQVLRKRYRMILVFTFISIFTAGFVSYFIMTKVYESNAAILVPREDSGGMGLAAAMAASGAGQLLGGLLPSSTTNRDYFVAILKSRTMAQDLVNRFKLQDYYGREYNDEAIKHLQKATDISTTKEGVVSVTVEDKDPQLAADIANAYVSNLDLMFARLGTITGSRQRAFLADQLKKTERDLRQNEEALRRFQERNKMVAMDAQARAGIDGAAQLKGQIMAAEVQLEVMRTFATENNPDVRRQKSQIEEMKRQLAQMQYGQGLLLPSEKRNLGEQREELQVPFVKVPELGMELIRLMREVKVQETVFILLTQQYEQAKISEAKDTPTVQLLDKAVPADKKSRPKTLLNMAIAGAMSLFIGIFLAFFLEYTERVRRQTKATVTV
jgi:tyrosine-protein kinase Etk/Wzc